MKITLDYDGPVFCDGCTMCDLENPGEVIFVNSSAPAVIENRPYICKNRRICENAIRLHADTLPYLKVGHWELINGGFELRCSECGRIRYTRHDYASRVSTMVHPLFCERCGASMENGG